ncbi:alkylated DNA repair dioxygenase AlkB [Lentimicrobium saccharophilum]|uniref:Alkylated DNA repair dioxygenase AlkB n=1 Tax=Lentimicrobium saccharophilum TaxID=1678841 RepID=A0A0S7BSB7_9BACT|nr:alpha-ketoglutarate-dependent dioxygenase AlkB [Lentimicrobium saccharophilum]GAP43548.1 alkylated DNA repair dioxygenase AlkB [Lentimicrobium saccharophilum]
MDNGILTYYPAFLHPSDCAHYIGKLKDEISWKQESIRIFGKSYLTPRLTAWYGDAGAVYSYSGLKLSPEPWSPALVQLRDMIIAVTGSRFNSVLLNWYRDGNDSMGWHADDEKELGVNPVIASLSLGQERDFRFRRKDNHRDTFNVKLANGSLLVMGGEIQHFWQHALHRSARHLSERINLTFRLIRPV